MVRKPAVAGMFYPSGKEQLQKKVQEYLKNSKDVKLTGELKALIVPHAGYVYSGIVAGAGFKLLRGKKYSSVILLGPAHQVYFDRAALTKEDFETPLGVVKVGDAVKWFNPNLIVDLPEAHREEHCLEVELPFLQETLKHFKLFPLVLGEVDERALAEEIANFIDEKTLVVVSSDLSHYYDYDTAVKKDQMTIKKILNFDFSSFEACGERPIKVLMHLAKKFGWKPFFIDYKNSGDTVGDKNRVVGYGCIGYCRV